VDNGELISAAVQSQDFGTIGDSPTTTQEYNEIVFTDVAYPYGSASFSGGATVNEFTRRIPTEKVEIKVAGTITANVVFHWTGSGTAFEISGGQELIVAPWTVSSGTLRNSFSKTIIGSGSLFSIGFIGEEVVYDYNLDSDVDYNINRDYGSVAQTVDEEFIVNGDFIVTGNYILATAYDFGSINENHYAGEYDYGLVNVTGTDESANVLFTLRGESLTDLIPVYTGIGTGLFEVSGGGIYEFKPNWIGRGQINLSGGEGDSFARPYIASGTLLGFNSSSSSASYSYNQNSLEEYSSIDIGSLTDIGYAQDSRFYPATINGSPAYIENYVNSGGFLSFGSTVFNKRYATHTINGSKYIILYFNSSRGLNVLNAWASALNGNSTSGFRSKTKYFNFNTKGLLNIQENFFEK
jgi:hypothetical protein